MLRTRCAMAALALIAAAVSTAASQPVTVVHDGKTVTIAETLADPDDLWTSPDDLTRINGFVLKPEGACLAEICIPIKQDRDSDLLITRSGRKWFCVSELARKLKQPFKYDDKKRLWTFGRLPVRN